MFPISPRHAKHEAVAGGEGEETKKKRKGTKKLVSSTRNAVPERAPLCHVRDMQVHGLKATKTKWNGGSKYRSHLKEN